MKRKPRPRRERIDRTEWPNQQALVPDEFRWMRAAIEAYLEAVNAPR